MSKVTINQTHSDQQPKPYLQVFIVLAILTAIEVGIGYLDISPLKITVLVILAVSKAALVAAIFMHVKYDKNPKLIVLSAFVVPLFGASILAISIYFDYRN